MPYKTCNCTQPATNFHHHPRGKDGLQSRCKTCAVEVTKGIEFEGHSAKQMPTSKVERRKAQILELIANNGPLSAADLNELLPGKITVRKQDVTSCALAELKELSYHPYRRVWGYAMATA